MFEKEAEEYAEGTKTKKEIEVLNTVHVWGEESLTPDERRLLGGIQDRKRAREQGFKDGAEFGFQKGKNEWHDLQKDPNDLPEETEFIESDVLLLLVQLRGTKHKRYELGSYVFSENVFSYTHLKFIEDVIAWKEIIPPKQEE